MLAKGRKRSLSEREKMQCVSIGRLGWCHSITRLGGGVVLCHSVDRLDRGASPEEVSRINLLGVQRRLGRVT